MSVTVLGGFVVAETLPEPDVQAVALGGVVTVHTLPGWEVVHREQVSLPSTSGGVLSGEFAQLTRGNGALDLLALPEVGGEPLELADLYAARRPQPPARAPVRVGPRRADPSPERTRGRPLRLHRVGAAERLAGGGFRHGRGLARRQRAIFDGWAFQGQLELIVEELAAMIEGAEVA